MTNTIRFFISSFFILQFFLLASVAFAGTNPVYEGSVKSQTGAPVVGAKVHLHVDVPRGCETTGSDENGNPTGSRCWNASSHDQETTTDGNGYYRFNPKEPFNCASNPQIFTVTINNGSCAVAYDRPGNMATLRKVDIACTIAGPTPTPINTCNTACTSDTECVKGVDGCPVCTPGANGTKTCQPAPTATPLPPTPTPTPPACGAGCTDDFACAGAKDGCTACRADATGRKICSPPPACGLKCEGDFACTGARDGCSVCVPQNDGTNVCAPPPACNTNCTRDDQCAKAVDGCTSCVDNDTGTGKSCKPVPACGVACTKDTQCAGAKDGCNTCTAGKCSSFSEDMCSCDGMDFTGPNGAETFFPGDNVTFVAYGKVPGKDWKGDAAGAVSHAQITSMSFALYQSKLTDPNTATLIAQSAAITPQVIENGASKVRYKVTWDKQIPATVPAGTLYRIQAKLKCSAKPGVLGATTTVGSTNYFSQLFDAVSGMFAKGSVLGESVRNNQQADTFFPGAKVQEKTCTFIKFFFE